MDKKYYTVAEFAKKVGVSPQYIYKQTKKQLRNYCKLVERHKVISESAFSLFAVENNETTSENEPVVVEYLLQQLKEKDGQIALLSEEVRRRSEEILELTKAFREAQALHAGTMQRELTDNNKRKWWKFWGRSGLLNIPVIFAIKSKKTEIKTILKFAQTVKR